MIDRLKGLIVVSAIMVTGMVANAAPAQEKQIRMREAADVAAGIKLAVQQTKRSYKVGEAIKLRAKVDRAAYVYIYTRDADSKYLTLLYPARPSDNNKLSAGKWAMLPPKQEFFGDAPGAEKIVVVATGKPIDLNTRYFTEEGKYMRASAESMTAAFAEKGIRLRDETPATKVDESQKILSVKIVK
jgi:hypothetical protein